MITAGKIKYLIIGNSAGGIGAAEAIRELDKVGAITIVSDEPYPAYSRPLISEYLVSRCPIERMLFRPTDFYKENIIQTFLGDRLVQVDFDEHTAKLESGRRLKWQKLLLATGGLPIVPKIEGAGLKGVFTFIKLNDAKKIDDFLNQHRGKVRAVVIGGGLIGVSVTEALVKRGVEVTIVEMKERILNTILDEETSAMEEEALKKAGVEIVTGNTVSKVNSNPAGEATSVNLDDSRSLPCEMVVIAIGVKPRMELVSDSEIKTNRGIVVDRHMATSMADVYTCGDVAEAYDFIHCDNRLNLIWPNAYIGGRIAGFNMAGAPTEYQGCTLTNAMKYFGLAIVSAGIVAPPDDSYDVISQRHDHIYRKVVLKDGFIAGMVFSGDIEKSGIIYNLMKDRVNVEDFKHVLVADDFGLASLPEEIWRPKLEMPAAALTSLPVSADKNEESLITE